MLKDSLKLLTKRMPTYEVEIEVETEKLYYNNSRNKNEMADSKLNGVILRHLNVY